uniref:Uncharacterized protein ycf23 n=1 Tax=Dasya binghamiae TaxID=1896963 RepID=A0A1C8XSC2_9FLOR|nr:hypothetical chloroplast RF23 [Dasya binghamiae]AOH77381.1 hypothetical chloroplast RF23 [Dasya binghamiae]
MHLFNTQLSIPFKSKKVIKVISGLNNLDIQDIIRMVKAAELSNAHYIDIVANTRVVSIIKSLSNLPLCVSSINPIELYNCTIAGADMVEIGNFDNFYSKNIKFSISQIYQLAKETRLLINNKDICVTIPHTLSLYDQVFLSKKLEVLGINILQTEGYLSSKYSLINCNDKNDMVLKSATTSASALSSTYAISNAVQIPIITASGIDYISSSMASYCGASGVGIGYNINKQKTIYDMSLYINEVYHSLISQINSNDLNDLFFLLNLNKEKVDLSKVK